MKFHDSYYVTVAERFCVRDSGALHCQRIDDSGCEYMTGATGWSILFFLIVTCSNHY